ncbi:UvrD-helicase domain-containing protein [Marinobacterium weihaiense]|uniref:DNA 3'-5' helicase n=1 Tax=Marinobacterium weihaiense TaxID=2851016 RepID=A0ABS6M717_9GAMM|nr:UvrD-helicase domain-containing protein [Marinobacterium weihaiense]MBV0932075.1 UvrD-helicase domain-containing protein [Marinobacterium weihaiense]
MTEQTPRVAIADKFMLALTRLPKTTQKKTLEFVSKFRQDPGASGINYEKINDAKDGHYRSVRIDQNYRGIVRAPDQGNVYLLLWVDKHDDAYDWARRHACEVHPGTGTLQIYESSEQPVNAIEPSVGSGASSEPLVTSEQTEPLFSLSEEQLHQIGVPQALTARVQSLTAEAELEALESRLPVEAYEPLYLLAAGADWQEIEQDYLAPQAAGVDTDDIAAALARPSSQRQFWVVDNDLELQAMLNAPLERWRVYLHPSQRKLVERHWNGPVRVLGGAGTGKTVVAMHRARWLVQQLLGGKEKLLFTTFTVNLATDIAANLRKICSAEELERIEVKHIDGWVKEFLRRNHYPHEIVYENASPEYHRIWQQALALNPALGLPDSFYKEEWERVILPQRVHTKAEYFKASRIGRGVALNRKQRAEIWPVFEEVRAQLNHQGLKTFEDATLDAVDLLQSRDIRLPYRSVIVDEAQDMGPQALTLIRQLLPEQDNDLFIVGDGHQRIYRRHAVMGHCGIRIVGRSRKLRINYRTTEETRRFASALLEGVSVDDLDGGEDQSTDYRSLLHGTEPVVTGYADGQTEQVGIAGEIVQLLEDGVESRDICIVTRVRKRRDELAAYLQQAGIAVQVLNQQTDNRNVAGVRLATMHRVKGLEFRYMFLAGINADVVPLALAMGSSDDPVEQQQNELNERALLHVAATRAVQGLYVSYAGEPSRFLR